MAALSWPTRAITTASGMPRIFEQGNRGVTQAVEAGVHVEEWGAWVEVDDRGNQLAVNGKGIFEIQFPDRGQRSINGTFLRTSKW